MSVNPLWPTNVKNGAVTIVNSDASALKTAITMAGVFSDLISLVATSDDTSDRLLQVFITIGGTDYLIGTVNVPTLSGTTASAPAVNLLTSANMAAAVYDAFGNKILRLDTALVVKVKSTTTVTAAKTVTVFAQAIQS